MTTTPAAARRESAREAYDVFMANCASRDIWERLSGKWVGLVVCYLADGPKRFGQVQRTIAGVSQKMLTQTLRGLERDGVITRTVTPSVPVRVDYALTPLGHSLVPVMLAVKQWAESNIADVHSARAAYDTRIPAGQEPIS